MLKKKKKKQDQVFKKSKLDCKEAIIIERLAKKKGTISRGEEEQ